MFSYDGQLLAAVRVKLRSLDDVVQTMATVDSLCSDGDGLKWFNWIYLEVTRAVAARIAAGGFANPGWMADLDVQFAGFFFDALERFLSGGTAPDCWRAMFERRDQTATARIQFALAGMNAHINHDLPAAIVKTCGATGGAPRHGSQQYDDFTALNSTLEGLIEMAKQKLLVRLLGDPLPAVSQLEDTIAAWNLVAAREAAWTNAEMLWAVRETPALADRYLRMLDGITAVAGKTLLVPLPLEV